MVSIGRKCPNCGANKADSAVTTGTEGTNNPVMAGKKNSKSRKQYNDWYKEEVTNQT